MLKTISALAVASAIMFSGVVGAQAASPQWAPHGQSHVQADRHDAKRHDVRSERRDRNDWRRKGGHYRGHGREVRDYRNYRLKTPPRGYHWVRDGNDYILVGVSSGIISAIINGR